VQKCAKNEIFNVQIAQQAGLGNCPFLKSEKSAIRTFALFCTFSLIHSFKKSDHAIAFFFNLLKNAIVQSHF